ncbi:diaminopimelate epimerase [Paenibacillus sp. SYP-B4298]|uniref:diaminopimelate epimerase n=1 Tax=Paenibacillus sp. SYP-B4298 TaxID=2996034 RepID=UPI0022DD4180|nr:diaminopimelate epimerase [Paenibacillus sp. SYP-B4298]
MRQEIEFVKCDPTQNMTVLVSSEHPSESRSFIAARLMSYDHVHAEQVGFIGAAHSPQAAASLHMAGGEFCGNACMALAAWIASRQELSPGGALELSFDSSGAAQAVACRVRRSDNRYICRVAMPPPRTIERRTFTYEEEQLEAVLVSYEQSFHLILEVELLDEAVRRKAMALARLLGMAPGSKLVGMMLYRRQTNELEPLIYVPALDSLVWERGCGSGTASLGAYLSWSRGQAIAAPIKQPGGVIHVYADCSNGDAMSIAIEGSVGIVAQGRAFIELESLEQGQAQLCMAAGGERQG